MRKVVVDIPHQSVVSKDYAAIAAPKVPFCIVEWFTKDGVFLQSHAMPEADAEAMADLLDAEAEIVLA